MMNNISHLAQDMDADVPLPDAMGGITMETEQLMDMLTMDGLTPATAARSCRDLSLDYPDYSDGMQKYVYFKGKWQYIFYGIIDKNL